MVALPVQYSAAPEPADPGVERGNVQCGKQECQCGGGECQCGEEECPGVKKRNVQCREGECLCPQEEKGLGLVWDPRTLPEVTVSGDPPFTKVLLEVSAVSAPLGDPQISVRTTGAHLGFIPPQD